MPGKNCRMHIEPGDGVIQSIDRIAGTLAVTRALVDAGRVVDLAGLDAEIGGICADTLDLPREQGRACLPALRALLGHVDALRAAMLAARRVD